MTPNMPPPLPPSDTASGYDTGTGAKSRFRATVAYLAPRDTLRFDPDPLARLYAEAGPDRAEDIVCRVLEEISYRLRGINAAHLGCEFDRLGREARGIAAVAKTIGLIDLAAAATHVHDCSKRVDATALGATVARLLRIGGRSLTEIGQVTSPYL
jgi:hypothetical protein